MSFLLFILLSWPISSFQYSSEWSNTSLSFGDHNQEYDSSSLNSVGNTNCNENDLDIFFNPQVLEKILDDGLEEQGSVSISLKRADSVEKGNDFKGSTAGEENPKVVLIDSMFDGSCSTDAAVLCTVLSKITSTVPAAKIKKKNSGFCKVETSSSIYKQAYIDMKQSLKRKIAEQLPNCPIGFFRDYEIKNWPDEVDVSAPYWGKKEIELIKSKFDDLIFIYRPTAVCLKNKMAIMNEVIIPFNDVHANILTRFRMESGFFEAKEIIWEMLDRTQLPQDYKNIKKSIYIIKVAMGNNFLEYIHFYRYANFYLPHLLEAAHKSEEFFEYDYRIRCRQYLLQRYRCDTGHENAKYIEWSRIDLINLPDKYQRMILNNVTVFDDGLFKDPDFLENVKFIEYSEQELSFLSQGSGAYKRKNQFEY